ncbi:MAG: helix-turn-helix domain-containing protein [Candidatus Thiodiazotropha sp. (ex Dulcina madagascariensis)]|nr:helix-turn-helix domain-containing protein [Candidatus Thiodiazotropha sp. (ex Dulcina madagascariensis)]
MTHQVTSYSALLGQIIGSLRLQKGLEQADLAQALGISQASYSRLEGGKAQWSIDQLMAASKILGLEVGHILQILERRVADLAEAANVEVISTSRANSRGAEERKNTSGGAFLTGAALGALLATLITRR